MRNKEILPKSAIGNPLTAAFLFFCLVMLGFLAIGPAIGMALSSPFFEGSLQEMIQAMQEPLKNEGLRPVLLITQAITSLIGLIVVPILFIKYIDKMKLSDLSNTSFSARAALSIFFIMISAMVVNSFFIEWNAGLDFGDDGWMKEAEDRAAEMTKFMTTFDSPGIFLLGFIAIAVLPGIGEEIVFRGYIQNRLWSAFKNPHVAIWISAILFSAIHLQFYGFIPRMLLGALFGYLYYWSGNLWMPILAHFLNNGLQVAAIYMVQRGVIDIDMDSTESYPLYQIALFAIILTALLIFFRKLFLEKSSLERNG